MAVVDETKQQLQTPPIKTPSTKMGSPNISLSLTNSQTPNFSKQQKPGGSKTSKAVVANANME